MHDYCYEKGFTIYPGKIADNESFRLCALGAIDVNDIESFFEVLTEALVSLKVEIPVKYDKERYN